MEKVKEYITVYTIGSVGYSLIEILWRGFTHWTMAITGGVGFAFLHLLNYRMKAHNCWMRSLAGSVVLTVVEFVSGCLVNRTFHMNVWDYSRQQGNLLGQICPLYCFLWFLLCFPVMSLNRLLQRSVF